MSLSSFLVVGDYLSDRFFLYQLFKAPRPPVLSKSYLLNLNALTVKISASITSKLTWPQSV